MIIRPFKEKQKEQEKRKAISGAIVGAALLLIGLVVALLYLT